MTRSGTQVRLNSLAFGFGDIKYSEGISLLYASLLFQYEMKFYSHIFITHTDDQSNEKIIKMEKQLLVSVFYFVDGFQEQSDHEKQVTFLSIIHEAFIRIAGYDSRYDIEKLTLIKEAVLEADFEFEILYKAYKRKKGIARILIIPKFRKFEYVFSLENENGTRCDIVFFECFSWRYQTRDLLNLSRWDKNGAFIVEGKRSDTIFTIDPENCSFVETLTEDTGRLDLVRRFRYNEDAGDGQFMVAVVDNKIFTYHDFINKGESIITLAISVETGYNYSAEYRYYDNIKLSKKEIDTKGSLPQSLISLYETFIAGDNTEIKLNKVYGKPKEMEFQQFYGFKFGTVAVRGSQLDEEKVFALPAEQRFLTLRLDIAKWVADIYRSIDHD